MSIKYDPALKTLINKTASIRERFAAGTPSDELQNEIQELFLSMSVDLDVSAMDRHNVEEYAEAIRVLRDHVWPSGPGQQTWTITDPDTPYKNAEEAREAGDEALAKAFTWPPIIPQVAVTILLVRSLISDGIQIEMATDIDVSNRFDFTPYKTLFDNKRTIFNGWTAFYCIYSGVLAA